MVKRRKLFRSREAEDERSSIYDMVVRMELENDPDVKEHLRYGSIYRDEDLAARLRQAAIRAEIKKALLEDWT